MSLHELAAFARIEQAADSAEVVAILQSSDARLYGSVRLRAEARLRELLRAESADSQDYL